MSLLLLLLLICQASLAQNASASWRWKWSDINSPVCMHCDISEQSICSTAVGQFLPSNHTKGKFDGSNACVRFYPARRMMRSLKEVSSALGANGVLVFVGDSNTRHLFLAALQFFGLTWYADLEAKASAWKVRDRRHKIDHTYLCPAPFGPLNLTLAFLWAPFTHKPQFYTKRPWSRCSGPSGQCASSRGISACDQSIPEGLGDRWQCGNWLDSVQTDGSRRFIVVSHGGIHDALHTYQAAQYGPDDRDRINGQVVSFRKTSFADHGQCWSSIPNHGKEIVISPLSLGRTRTGPTGRWGINEVLQLIADEQRQDGDFSAFIDGYALSSEENSPPFTTGDGIHYPPVLYRALLELLWDQVTALQ